MSLDAILCAIPSTWSGDRPYVAPQALHPLEDAIVERVPDPLLTRSVSIDQETPSRSVSPEAKKAVAGELWPTVTRTSHEIYRSLASAGYAISHHQVRCALVRLEAQGKAKRSVCSDKKRHARWLWRQK